MQKIKDLTGQKFNKITAVSYCYKNRNRKAVWLFRCDCGEVFSAVGASAVSGNTTSCGCEKLIRIRKANTRHGMTGTPTYVIWRGMKDRCYNSNCEFFHRYGGRGITICPEWLESFPVFLKDMGKRPEGMSIDRINNDLGYSPDNCRWATQQQQCSNTVRNRHITFNGATRTLAEWARHTGINRGTINSRLQVGHSIAHALTAPIKGT